MFFELTFPHLLVIVSAAVSLAGGAVYIRDTLYGTTRPNRVTWSMWALAPLVGTAAALSAHADIWATSRTFLAGFIPLIVFGVTFFNRRSYWRLEVFDLACGFCSLAAIVIWLFVGRPEISVLFAALGDGLAAVPTIRKAWKHPETETGLTFIASIISVLLILPSIPIWNIQNSAFPIYLISVNILLLIAIYRRKSLTTVRSTEDLGEMRRKIK